MERLLIKERLGREVKIRDKRISRIVEVDDEEAGLAGRYDGVSAQRNDLIAFRAGRKLMDPNRPARLRDIVNPHAGAEAVGHQQPMGLEENRLLNVVELVDQERGGGLRPESIAQPSKTPAAARDVIMIADARDRDGLIALAASLIAVTGLLRSRLPRVRLQPPQRIREQPAVAKRDILPDRAGG